MIKEQKEERKQEPNTRKHSRPITAAQRRKLERIRQKLAKYNERSLSALRILPPGQDIEIR